jgi:hypothetical protein
MELIGILFVTAWAIFMVYSWFSKSPVPSTQEDSMDADIGFVVGMMGGGIEDAAHVRYALSRLQEQLGRRPTRQELMIAVGIQQGSDLT